MAEKRPTTEEGDTPGKPRTKQPCSEKTSRKQLFGETEALPQRKRTSVAWTEKEEVALVQYICLYSPDAHIDNWPKTKDKTFWQDCAHAVNHLCKSNRTEESCRSRVVKEISKRYARLSDAETALGICYIENQETDDQAMSTPLQNQHADPLSPAFCFSPGSRNTRLGDTVKNFVNAFKKSQSTTMKEQLLLYLFKLFVIEMDGFEFFKFVQRDFITLSLDGMKTLFDSGNKNIVHSLAKCFCQTPEKTTKMPLDRMPYGLIDYNIRFFASRRTQKLEM